MAGGVEPMQVDMPEENDNEAGLEEAEEQSYLVDNPSLDLEATSNAYDGLAKLYRLQFIAEHCPCYRVEALKLAINYVQNTFNTTLYQRLHRKLQDCIGILAVAVFAVCICVFVQVARRTVLPPPCRTWLWARPTSVPAGPRGPCPPSTSTGSTPGTRRPR
jgi:COP9 signalosome complex subunit 1